MHVEPGFLQGPHFGAWLIEAIGCYPQDFGELGMSSLCLQKQVPCSFDACLPCRV